MNKLALFGLTILTISAFADDEIAAAGRQRRDWSSQRKEEQVCMNSLPEERTGWYAFADALYWHADVGSTEWAWNIQDVNATVLTGDLESFKFEWEWGFRVGLGAKTHHDKWDTNLSYTWFYTHESHSTGNAAQAAAAAAAAATASISVSAVSATTILNANASANNIQGATLGNTFTSGKVDWSIHFSMFDWELGRWYHASEDVCIRPHVGLKGGWIDQNVHYHLTNDISTFAPSVFSGNYHYENDFWGIGPSAGANMMWVFGKAGKCRNHRFSLVFDLGAALLYGHFDVDHVEKIYAASQLVGGSNPTDLDINLAVPMIQTMIGLSWDTPFNRDRGHFTFKVGYEFQYWWRQQQQVRAVMTGISSVGGRVLPTYPTFERIADDLSLQGLTIDFRFDF